MAPVAPILPLVYNAPTTRFVPKKRELSQKFHQTAPKKRLAGEIQRRARLAPGPPTGPHTSSRTSICRRDRGVCRFDVPRKIVRLRVPSPTPLFLFVAAETAVSGLRNGARAQAVGVIVARLACCLACVRRNHASTSRVTLRSARRNEARHVGSSRANRSDLALRAVELIDEPWTLIDDGKRFGCAVQPAVMTRARRVTALAAPRANDSEPCGECVKQLFLSREYAVATAAARDALDIDNAHEQSHARPM
mmetsp:Transcript_3135/g.8745  ORF Transcript_3135/g.8745 Transcript_3135/m.8745 type:complete len:250 (-) Transcript_3135:13-762(-)